MWMRRQIDDFIREFGPHNIRDRIDVETAALRQHMREALYRPGAPSHDDLIYNAPDGLYPAARARVGREAVRVSNEMMLAWSVVLLDEFGIEVVP